RALLDSLGDGPGHRRRSRPRRTRGRGRHDGGARAGACGTRRHAAPRRRRRDAADWRRHPDRHGRQRAVRNARTRQQPLRASARVRRRHASAADGRGARVARLSNAGVRRFGAAGTPPDAGATSRLPAGARGLTLRSAPTRYTPPRPVARVRCAPVPITNDPEEPMKRWLLGVLMLAGSSAIAQVPVIAYDGDIDFLKLPKDLYLGEVTG